jgi:hypothetical protein
LFSDRRVKKQAVSPSKRGRKSYVEKDPSCLSPEKGIENMLSRNYKQLSEKKKDMIYNALGDEAIAPSPAGLAFATGDNVCQDLQIGHYCFYL